MTSTASDLPRWHRCLGYKSTLALVCALIAPVSSCVRTAGNFSNMQIDPQTLKVRLEGNLPLSPKPASDYYFKFLISGGGYTVTHFEPTGKVYYDDFTVNADGTLSSRFKRQLLLSGPFGNVYAETTYFYAPEYSGQETQFFTVPNSNGGHEPFQLVSSPPSTRLELSAISVVRIFRAAPEFLIASANYAPDGHLESLHVNGSEHGEWVHSNTVHALYPGLDVATVIGDRPSTREKFGIPKVFPVQQYLGRASSPFGKSSFTIFMDAVNLHYDRNRWVQQDIFLPDATHQKRYLTYRVTRADEILASIDNSRGFGQFAWTRTSGAGH